MLGVELLRQVLELVLWSRKGGTLGDKRAQARAGTPSRYLQVTANHLLGSECCYLAVVQQGAWQSRFRAMAWQNPVVHTFCTVRLPSRQLNLKKPNNTRITTRRDV